jgi:hypothetical protein
MAQLDILLTDGSTTVVVAIPPNMATVQPGLHPADTMVATIFKRGYFWDPTQTKAYPVTQIKSIAYQ